MQGLSINQLIWYGVVLLGAYGAINALSEGRIDAALMWGTFVGFFASLEFGARP